jgi:HEAT repeat protein
MTGCDLAREPLLGWLQAGAKSAHGPARRVHAAHGLARLGDRAAVPALRAALEDDDENVDVRRGAVLALGALAAADDADTAKALVRALERDRDRGVRNMSAIALGRIGPAGAAKALARNYERSDGATQPFVALGLGLLARRDAASDLTAPLRRDLRDAPSPDLRAALAVAL